MDENDWINKMADVNILQAEAVASVVGRVVAALRKGMIDAGMDESAADALVVSAWAETYRILMFGGPTR